MNVCDALWCAAANKKQHSQTTFQDGSVTTLLQHRLLQCTWLHSAVRDMKNSLHSAYAGLCLMVKVSLDIGFRLGQSRFAVGALSHTIFLGYQVGWTPTGWPHTAIRQARLPGARGKASPARYA